MRRFGFLLTGLLILCLSSQYASAAQIKAIKGKKVLVDMQSDNFNSGDILKVQNSSGKTTGLVKLTKIKGRMAEGQLKGKAEKGFAVKLRPANSKQQSQAKKSSGKSNNGDTNSGTNTGGKTAWGMMAGFNSNSAEIKLGTVPSTTVSLTGTGFSLKGFVDYPVLSWLDFRGLAGLEQFNVGGVSNTATNGCAGECIAEISYITFDMWGRYIMGSGNFKPWAGIGFSLMFPMSKSATALNEKSITNTSTSPFAIGGGLDWWLSNSSFVPIQVEYVPYPSTDDVSASAIAARVGYGMSF